MDPTSAYLSSTWETLATKWTHTLPSQISQEDLKTGVHLLTKLALEAIEKEDYHSEDLSVDEDALQFPDDEFSFIKNSSNLAGRVESLQKEDDLPARVNSFVKRYADRFIFICESGFPFAHLGNTTALKHALENHRCVVFDLMNESTWLSESELNELYGPAFNLMSANELNKACSSFINAYTSMDFRAGYYLLWLIKQRLKSSYELPHPDSFTKHTVKETLAHFSSEDIYNTADPIVLVELFCGGEKRPYSPLYMKILDEEQQAHFFNFVIMQLKDIPLEKWPQKLEIVKDLLEQDNIENRYVLAQTLAESFDPQTAKVGKHLTAAFQAESLKEAIPHYYALTQLLPNLNESHFMNIFGRPFIEFKQNNRFYKDPEFVKRLNFTDNFFVYGSLMIGVYNPRGELVPPHLMAYDANSEKLLWGIPLVPIPKSDPFQHMEQAYMGRMGSENYKLEKVENYITFQWVGQQTLHYIDLEMGCIVKSIAMPYALNESNDIHIHSTGFTYQMVSLEPWKLIGGKIVGDRYQPSFECKIPPGDFTPLSTHAGFQKDEETLFIINSIGAQMKLECFSAKAKDDKLYLIEPNPTCRNSCLLTIRTLHDDESVISEVEKSFPLAIKKATFIACCDNGKIILLADNKKPIFVDLSNEKVVYSQHRVSSHMTYSPSGELWSCDKYPANIWKITSTQAEKMATLTTNNFEPVHIDENGGLYILEDS